MNMYEYTKATNYSPSVAKRSREDLGSVSSTHVSNDNVLSKCVPILILASAFFVAITIIVHAQTDGVESAVDTGESAGITFPVPELGACASKVACKTYCSEQAHMEACISFAQAHGLMNKEEVDRAEKFRAKLEEGGGPGGCKSPAECETFCRDIKNLDTCISFAEQNGVKDTHIEEGRKIRTYLKSGGAMPGGCSSKETCEAYCGNFSHAEECFTFAKKAGIGQGGPRSDRQRDFENGEPSPEQFEKLMELVKNRQTPGGCESKDACEEYCQDKSHFEECVSFGEKVGFVKPDEAERIRKSGGRGPGGCDGPEKCRAYCAEQTHREECFSFGKEHGFIKPEDETRMKDGLVRMKAGLEQAPPEVQTCIKSALGDNFIEQVQSGNAMPGPEVGDAMHNCFEKFGGQGKAGDFMKQAPPEVTACLKEKVGDSFEKIAKGEEQPTPEVADAFRACQQLAQFAEGDRGGEPGTTRDEGMRPGPIDFLRSAPPEIATCLKEKLGGDFEKLQSRTSEVSSDVKEKMRGCFESFKPSQEMRGSGGGEGKMIQNEYGRALPQPGGSGANFPPEVANCLRGTMGDEAFQLLMRGSKPSADVEAKVGECFTKANQSGRNFPPGDRMEGTNPRNEIMKNKIAPFMQNEIERQQMQQGTRIEKDEFERQMMQRGGGDGKQFFNPSGLPPERQFPPREGTTFFPENQGGQFPSNEGSFLQQPPSGMTPPPDTQFPQSGTMPQPEMQQPQSRLGGTNPFASIFENLKLFLSRQP